MHLNWLLISLFFYFPNLLFLHTNGDRQPSIHQDKTERKAYLTRLISEFVSWPDQESTGNGFFHVSVYNDEDFYKYLTYLYKDVEIKGMETKVSLISNVESIYGSHILFLTEESSTSIEEILKLTNNQPILTIGDCKDFGSKGTIVNFIDVQDEVKFEINLNSYKNSELKIDSRLFDVAKIID